MMPMLGSGKTLAEPDPRDGNRPATRSPAETPMCDEFVVKTRAYNGWLRLFEYTPHAISRWHRAWFPVAIRIVVPGLGDLG